MKKFPQIVLLLIASVLMSSCAIQRQLSVLSYKYKGQIYDWEREDAKEIMVESLGSEAENEKCQIKFDWPVYPDVIEMKSPTEIFKTCHPTQPVPDYIETTGCFDKVGNKIYYLDGALNENGTIMHEYIHFFFHMNPKLPGFCKDEMVAYLAKNYRKWQIAARRERRMNRMLKNSRW